MYFGISSFAGLNSDAVFDILQVNAQAIEDEEIVNDILKDLDKELDKEVTALETKVDVLKYRLK